MVFLYSPKRVSGELGISYTTLCKHIERYASYLSVVATTTPRKFTEDDFRVLAFVVESRNIKSHEQILATWEQSYPAFKWKPDWTNDYLFGS